MKEIKGTALLRKEEKGFIVRDFVIEDHTDELDGEVEVRQFDEEVLSDDNYKDHLYSCEHYAIKEDALFIVPYDKDTMRIIDDDRNYVLYVNGGYAVYITSDRRGVEVTTEFEASKKDNFVLIGNNSYITKKMQNDNIVPGIFFSIEIKDVTMLDTLPSKLDINAIYLYDTVATSGSRYDKETKKIYFPPLKADQPHIPKELKRNIVYTFKKKDINEIVYEGCDEIPVVLDFSTIPIGDEERGRLTIINHRWNNIEIKKVGHKLKELVIQSIGNVKLSDSHLDVERIRLEGKNYGKTEFAGKYKARIVEIDHAILTGHIYADEPINMRDVTITGKIN